eukprot:gnl/MRDRNA2_/MRDRNA2_94131_c0_seq1.p1 gnl/MRDRNA2_/MRDRNA2_94131_c0~~gnl/MRDRNA2_/MRDRNA2_94131_c0_seq1.p1  ORF type:complete len:127 (+),score=28.96 gnl/MRDRNA2_/MRDRNA2_94131_c0_seq1:97-477(+)
MGAACSNDHEMMGEWSFTSELEDGATWNGTLHVLEGTEEHFEGDMTGVLKKFKASGGKWSATLEFDTEWFKGEDGKYRYLTEGDTFTLAGTYEDESAVATITPGKSNKGSVVTSTWTLEKIGEATE